MASRVRENQQVQPHTPQPTAPRERVDRERVEGRERWQHERDMARVGRDFQARHPNRPPAVRDERSGRWQRWDGDHHDHYTRHRETVVFWAGGWPLCYYYPWSGYVEYVEPYTYYESPPQPVINGEELNYSYYDLGTQWGQDLRGSAATWQQFVDYLHDYLIQAPMLALEDFRRGFEAGYGANAPLAFDQAFRQAQDQ